MYFKSWQISLSPLSDLFKFSNEISGCLRVNNKIWKNIKENISDRLKPLSEVFSDFRVLIVNFIAC